MPVAAGAEGDIAAWGWNEEGQCTVPAPNSDFVAIAAGEIHSLGLKSDGSIVAWGWNDYGQCDVPAPNANFVALAAGYFHSLGLKGMPVPGDLDGDRDVDIADFSLFQQAFAGPQ